MRDYRVSRPLHLDTYALHRYVYALTEGHPRPLFADDVDAVLIRTTAPLGDGDEIPNAEPALYSFELETTVAYRERGRTCYWPSSNRAVRENWLNQEGLRHGFEIIAVHISARKDVVRKPSAEYALDKTRFTGVLRVLDASLVANALRSGVGRVGKAYGSGLLRIKRIT